MTEPARERPAAWKWWVCGLLLCASTINYMDRQTLASAIVRISDELGLNHEQYGNLELAFGWAFAAGSLAFGWLADRVPVRWLYPVVLALWSLVGFATGLVHSYTGLMVCRTLLGLFESGHWPCALKTTQRLLNPGDRSLGNSVLQSGTSIGAMVTPLLMNWMMTPKIGSWRYPFQAIGVIGVLWIFFWLALVRPGEMGIARVLSGASSANRDESFIHVLFSRRCLIVLVTISLINICFQFLRAWLPRFLQEGRGYTESAALHFNAAFYVATDIGCLGAGALALWLHRRSMGVHRARVLVFFFCAVLTGLSTVASVLPAGGPLLFVLLLVGAGGLGLFGIYHALTQDLTHLHQGKVTGIAGVVAWAIGSPTHKYFGRWVDQSGSFDRGMAIIGWLPMAAFLCIWLFWDSGEKKALGANARPVNAV
jgi:ACS family hexuronate transporter-like MFS transporter